MKIGIISDTHIPSMGKEPPAQIIPAFEGVEVILHGGDIYIPSCIEWLERIAPVHYSSSAFAGGGEGAPRVSVPVVVELGGHTIGLIHKLELTPLGDDIWPGAIAHGYPKGGATIPADLADVFGKPVDIVVFGYTHEAMIETHQGILFLNPGSPNMVKQSMKLGTVAILDLTPEGPKAEIIDLTTIKE